jgi:Protein of unknown function (DUF2846)
MKIYISFLIVLIFSFSIFGQTEKENINKLSGKAIVYFYSLKTIKTLGQVKKPIFLDDKEIADVRPERYFIVLIEPGNHNFRLKDKKFGGIEMNFEAGKIYYIKMGWQADAMLKPSGISRVEPESGAFDIKQLKPVDEKNIKDKTVVYSKIN